MAVKRVYRIIEKSTGTSHTQVDATNGMLGHCMQTVTYGDGMAPETILLSRSATLERDLAIGGVSVCLSVTRWH